MTGRSALGRQFGAFVVVGLAAAVAHYGILIGLVEGARMDPLPATLLGFGAGAAVSYTLNRRLTYRSDRPHREAFWRFAIVSGVGFALTGALAAFFVRGLGLPYLPAQVVTTGIVLFWNFSANRLWTFRVPPVP